MRNATLYMVEKKEVRALDYVEITKCDPLGFDRILTVNNPLPEFAISFERLPVNRITRFEQGEYKNQFYAFDRELQQIVDCLVREAEDPWKKQARDNWKVAEEWRKVVYNFVDLPWYKRIWRAIKKEIK